MNEKESIYLCMSERINNALRKINSEALEEIRLRRSLPLGIVLGGESFFIGKSGIVKSADEAYTVTEEDISYSLLCITKGSYYSFEDEIKNGFVTIQGGHRVGVCGRGVIENGKIISISEVSSLNFRVSRQIKNSADEAIRIIKSGNDISSTLIISPPGMGKTTMLREIARLISDFGFKVSVIDERCEICALSSGEPGFDIGKNTDVYSLIPKDKAIPMAVRCLSPHVIITDELGKKEDYDAVSYASYSGVSVIASIHGKDIDDAKKKKTDISDVFKKYIVIGENKKILKYGEV